MKRLSLVLVAAVAVSLTLTSNEANAQKCGTKAGASSCVPPSYHGNSGTRTPVKPYVPQGYSNAGRGNGGSGFTGYGGGYVTRGAWVGYNMQTRRYAIAFDTPGDSGAGILMRSGYWSIVRGPTTWTDAVSYLKSIGAQGW